MEKCIFYVCPVCKKTIRAGVAAYRCDHCGMDFPVITGLPDFTQSSVYNAEGSLMRRAYGKFFNLIAPIYESPAWYQLTLNLSGAGGNSIRSIAEFLQTSMTGIGGSIIDIACGTATYSRRIVLPAREVYGIDLSVGMLRQGMRYLERETVERVHLSRASVMSLPFASEVFDGAVCAGSLHLFSDPDAALREIRRTMKNDAPLAVQTFVPKNSRSKLSIKKRTGFHEYQAGELIELLVNTGFAEVSTLQNGTVLFARAKRVTASK